MPIRFARGITLIELMVVVAIVAIIAAIAYPSFQNGLQHSRRADAFKTLLTMQLKQEEYRITSSAYSTNLADLGNPSSNYYSFSVVAASTGAASGGARCRCGCAHRNGGPRCNRRHSKPEHL